MVTIATRNEMLENFESIYDTDSWLFTFTCIEIALVCVVDAFGSLVEVCLGDSNEMRVDSGHY